MEIEIKGKTVLIDAEDYERVKAKKWHFCNRYARTRDGYNHIYMHQFILGKKEGFVIDHINRNVLDNRKSNLRHCLPAQNSQNRNKLKNKSSRYMGVCLASGNRAKKWRALLKGKLLGYFENEIDAAVAYNKAAKELYGDYAPLNVIGNE